jgi:integrase
MSAQPKSAELLKLPETLTMSDAREYAVKGDVWILPEDPAIAKNVRFDWTRLTNVIVTGTSTPVMSVRAVRLAQLYILERVGAPKRSITPLSAQGILTAMLYFARWLGANPEWLPAGRGFNWSNLTAEMFEAWLTSEYRAKRKGSSAMLMRRFYLWGADPDASRPGFSSTLASVLGALSIKRHATGELVESRNAKRGPFTREELQMIFDACESGAGNDQDRAIAWTFLLTAVRPKQLVLLTNQDLEVDDDAADDGRFDDTLTQAPYRVKVRKIKRKARITEYHFLPLSAGCARLLLNLRRTGSGPTDPLFWWIPRSYYGTQIHNRLKAFSEDADLRSPRIPVETSTPEDPLYERMHLSPRRFRYGVATDRIARGEKPDEVAAMLGHKGTESLRAYVETSPWIADEFQRATDYAIAPLIYLMEGRAAPSQVISLADVDSPVTPNVRQYSDAPVFMSGLAPPRLGGEARKRRPADVSTRQPSGLAKSEAKIEELIARARRKFTLIYPGQDFDSQIWAISHLTERPNVTTLVSFGFSTQGSTDYRLSARQEDALPPYFAEVIKSWMVISSDVTTSYNYCRLAAARHFWNFMSTLRGRRAVSFRWGALLEDDLLGFEQFLNSFRANESKPFTCGTINQYLALMQRLADFLASYGICRRIDYIPRSRRPARGTDRLSLDEKRMAAELKLPAAGVLESLAGIYHRLTTAPTGEVNDWVLIIISALAILMLTGLRVGELVTLPFDCEVEEKRPGRAPEDPESSCYGLRYWVEKMKTKPMRIKWISPTAVPVVRASIARIKRLTADARQRAKILEADPTRVPLPPEIASRIVLPRSELLPLVGLKWDTPIRTDPRGLLPQYGEGRKSYYYVKDLEAYLLWRRERHLYTVRHEDGTLQMLSASLFIIFTKQSRERQMGPCRLLVEPVKAATIKFYLCAPTNVFKTYGDAEWQRGLSANPHSFRHWLIHVAYKGGMETHHLLRYFAKRFLSGISDYLHFSSDESDAYAPEELSAGQFYVPVCLPEGETLEGDRGT